METEQAASEQFGPPIFAAYGSDTASSYWSALQLPAGPTGPTRSALWITQSAGVDVRLCPLTNHQRAGHRRAKGDKITRMAAHSAKIEAGHVLLPERAPWLGNFRAELLAFPSGRYDAQVDSLSQFLTWRDERKIVRQGHMR